MSVVKEFKKFVARGSVVDLAVGVIIGAAFSSITKSLVDDILSPVISLVTGGVDFSKKGIILRDSDKYANAVEAAAANVPVMLYGNFINACINFLLVALVLFAVVKAINRVKDARQKEEMDPASPAEPPPNVKLLTEIRDLLASQARSAEPPESTESAS